MFDQNENPVSKENFTFDTPQPETSFQPEIIPRTETPPQPETFVGGENYFRFVKPQPTEEQLEKRDIRFAALALAVPFLFLFMVSTFSVEIYKFIFIDLLKFSYKEAVELSGNSAVQQLYQVAVSSFCFLVPFTLIAKCMRLRIDQTVSFKRPKKGTFLPFVFFGVGFCIFANIAASRVDSFFNFSDVEYSFSYNQPTRTFFGFALDFIATAIVPALVEEYACRGIVLGRLRKHGDGFAIVISSLLFGLMHGNFEQMPFAFVVGLALGYVYVKTESIWACILVHATNNAVSVFLDYSADIIGVELEVVLYSAYLVLGMLLAIWGIYLFAKSGKEDYSLKPSSTAVTQGKKCLWYCTSWATLLVIAVYLFQAMCYFPFFYKMIYG